MSRLMIVEVPSYSCEFKGIREICELVRCAECRYYRDYDGCFFSTAEVEPDGYCHWGERKESE